MSRDQGFEPITVSETGIIPRRECTIAASGDILSSAWGLAPEPRMILMRETALALVRHDGRDLSARQVAVFLVVYMDDAIQSVSSLAGLLNISRPAVTRILDRLIQFDLAAREEVGQDRRRVLVRRTRQGTAFFHEMADIARSVSIDQPNHEREHASVVPVRHRATAARAVAWLRKHLFCGQFEFKPDPYRGSSHSGRVDANS